MKRENGLTREDMEEYDRIANRPNAHIAMTLEQRKERYAAQQWKIIQEGPGGGSGSVPTTAYPSYKEFAAAKQAPPLPPGLTSDDYDPPVQANATASWSYRGPQGQASSSIGWSQSGWWSTAWSSYAPNWKDHNSWNKRWQ